MQYQFSVTTLSGATGTFEGGREICDTVIKALKKAGARFHEDSQSWDFGFYDEPEVDPENIYNSPSIAQSIREA